MALQERPTRKGFRSYEGAQISQFLARSDAGVVVAAHLMPDSNSQDRLSILLDGIRGLIAAAGWHALPMTSEEGVHPGASRGSCRALG